MGLFDEFLYRYVSELEEKIMKAYPDDGELPMSFRKALK